MNFLPDLVLFKIFDHLNLDELIFLRVISKRFKYLIDQYKIKELIVRDRHDTDYSWYSTCEPVNLNNSIFVTWITHIYDSLHFRRFFRNCKRMKLRLNGEFSYDYLNEFKNLEHLEVDNNLYYIYGMNSVNLPNLRILKILIQSSDGKLIIDSEKLEILCLSRFETVRLVNGRTVRSLQVESFENENLMSLENLEVFKCNYISNPDNLLLELPKNLKEIHAFNFCLDVRDEELRVINLLLEQRSKFKNLNVYFKSIKINAARIDDDFLSFKDHFLDYYLMTNKYAIYCKYYDHLEDKISWVGDIDYNLLMDVFDYLLPVNFHNKFINIHHVEAKKIAYQDQFYQFLSQCRNLTSLILDNPSLNQNFYDQLAEIPFFIEHFFLKENEIELDFQFILKLHLLTDFNTDQNLPMQLIIDILIKLIYIRNVDLAFNKIPLKVQTEFKNWFTLDYSKKNERKTWNYLTKDEFLNVCNNLEQNYDEPKMYLERN